MQWWIKKVQDYKKNEEINVSVSGSENDDS
jgi:hypothetical protein